MSAPTPVDVVDDGGAFSTLVIEDGVIPRRVRRPADLLRLAIALVAFAVTVAITYFLNATSAGIEQDLVQASTGLPAIAGTVLNLVGGLGVLLLPVAAGIDMIVRRRGRQLVDAMAAAFLGIVLAVLVAGPGRGVRQPAAARRHHRRQRAGREVRPQPGHGRARRVHHGEPAARPRPMGRRRRGRGASPRRSAR